MHRHRYACLVALSALPGSCPEDVRDLEELIHRTHGPDPHVYSDRVRQLLHALPQITRLLRGRPGGFDPAFVAGLDSVALRSDEEMRTRQAYDDEARAIELLCVHLGIRSKPSVASPNQAPKKT